MTVVVDVPPSSPAARRAARLVDAATYRDRSLAFGTSVGYGDLLLFLRSGVRPWREDWLGALVAAVEDTHDTVAAGPVTVIPGGAARAGYRPGWYRGVPAGAALEVASPAALASERREVSAVDGSCLLVRRDAFEAAGGWDPAFLEGWAELDLCARLRAAGGRIVVTTDAYVFDEDGDRRGRPGRSDHERAEFGRRWAVELGREAREAYPRLDEPSSAVIGSATGLDLPPPLAVHSPDRQPSADRLIVTDPGYSRTERVGATVKVAVAESLDGWENAGFDAYDAVGVPGTELVDHLWHRIAPVPVDVSGGTSALWEAARRSCEAPRIAWRVGSPPGAEGERWGDTHLARHLAGALRPLGFASTVTPLPFWDHPAHQAVDVAVHLHGLADYVPKPGHVNVLWVISHPERVTPEMAERFDLVLVASDSFANELAGHVSAPVHPFLQATDTHLFRPLGLERDIPVLFVGNSRLRPRPIVEWAIEAGLPIRVYGGDWEGIIPDELVVERFVPNHRLPELYNRAQVVLNDHWPDMAARGFVSNRIFDVAATGTALVTDPVEGLGEAMGGSPAVARDAADLGVQVGRLLDDRLLADRLGAQSRRSVEERHSADVRAAQFVSALAGLDTPAAAGIVARAGRRVLPH